jgi:hypothetical protein
MVELVLNELNAEITSSNALLDGKEVLLDGIDACAVYELSVGLFKSIFLFQTDSTYNANQKIKYYTFAHPEFNALISNSKLDKPESFGEIAKLDTNTMIISCDYIRYLALRLFGTHLGVDLFINEEDMDNDIKTKLNQCMTNNYNICQGINALDGTDGSLNTDTVETYEYDYRISRYTKCYTKYFLDSNTENKNLCRELMLQMLLSNPQRFQNIQNTSGKQSLPFIAGDSINFKIGINPADDQELMTGVSVIPKRTYQIKIILIDTIYPAIPTRETTAIVSYTGINMLYPTITFTNYSSLNAYDFVVFKVTLYIQKPNTNINDGENSYLSTYLKIYPKAFPSNGIITFPFNNMIDGNSNYEITPSATLPYGRIFYLLNLYSVNNASNYITIKNYNNEFIFEINPNVYYVNNTINFQVELQNNGNLPLQDVSSKNFDINFI